MEKSAVPAVLKIGARSRSPVVPTGYDELFGDAIKNRIQTRIGELDRDIGRVTLEQPNPPLEPLPRGGNTMLPPSDDAVGGVVPVVRSGFIAKYDPDHPGRGTDFDSTDPFWEYDWINPAGAIDGPWLVPRHRGLRKIIDGGSLHPGDLVFLLRTKGLPGERESHPSLARRTLVGVCWAELVGSYFPEVDGPGATLFPIRRFNFPVPVCHL